jgi:hypothetical protein
MGSNETDINDPLQRGDRVERPGSSPWVPEYILHTHEDITVREGNGHPNALIVFPPVRDYRTGQPIPTYPKSSMYEFQEFAGLVFELGGYGDITMINPYTGLRLWISQDILAECASDDIYAWMRKAIDIAQECRFLDYDAAGTLSSQE